MKVVFCTPSLNGPHPRQIEALEASIPIIQDAGWEEGYVHYLGSQYISHSRAELARRAREVKADVIFFLDYDLSWSPPDLLKLLNADGDVVAGVYRFREPTERYMGSLLTDENGKPQVRHDGAVAAIRVPAGFLKVTEQAFQKMEKAYPELIYHDPEHPERHALDLFAHGPYNGVWWGEDMAFCRRWKEMGEDIWVMPNLTLIHWHKDIPHYGNLHEFLLRQPGGRLHGEHYDPSRQELPPLEVQGRGKDSGTEPQGRSCVGAGVD